MYHNVLVTGGCGFIASNFLNYMVEKYPNINFVNLDAMYYCASLDNLTVSELPNYAFYKGKVQDQKLVSEILEKHNIDAVLHFAAQSHVDNSFGESLTYTEDNVLGTHVLLECSRKYGKVKRFIHVSTDEVYGESSKEGEGIVQKSEQAVLCPTNPYAATKAAAEMIVNSYIHSYNMPIIITRGNNVYGPNQYPEKLIPKFIQLLQNDKKMTIQGKGNQLRSFLHAFDVAKAFELILMKGQLHEIYNVGTTDEITVMEVAEKLLGLIKPGEQLADWIEEIPDREYNDFRYFITNEKLKGLGWEQTIGFDEGLGMLCQVDDEPNKIIKVGVVGNGFVGKATTILENSEVELIVYDINPELCKPKGTTVKDLAACSLVFVSVPTPMNNDGSCHLDIVKSAISSIREVIDESKTHIVLRSTVPIGTSKNLKCFFMPEFLTEANFKQDFKSCKNWIFGCQGGKHDVAFKKSITLLFRTAYINNCIDSSNLTFLSTCEAEAVKYARNTFLATKVAFCNEFYVLCQKLGLDYDAIRKVSFSDTRIGLSHTTVPGPDGKTGFGGTCFPKDINSMIFQMSEANAEPVLLSAANERNNRIDRSEKDWENNLGRAVVGNKKKNKGGL
jgi:dTDP-glucose 4,6-dehydratase